MTTASARRGRTGRRWGALVLASLLLSVWAVSAAAAEGNKVRAASQEQLPIEITADRLLADSARETVTFEGNVRAEQGEVTLFSDRLSAEYSGEAKTIEKITAEGHVRMIHGDKVGQAERAVFFNGEQKIVLTGGATLSQGEDSLAGDNVTIYLRENRSVVTGGSEGRVRAVIHPRNLLDRKEKDGGDR